MAANSTEVFGSNQSADRAFSLNIIFVGLAPETVDTPLIESNIQKSHSFTYENYTINYDFETSYYFANSSYCQALRSFILTNSVIGTTSRLNTTALQIQRSTGTKKSIFLEQQGRAINALAVESWLVAHPCIGSGNPAYCFYVMNFTELDSSDHTQEHWYNVTETDLEANNRRDYWRLQWDNALNPDVKFPYAGFTSQSRVRKSVV